MDINTFSVIGKTHKICQDYSLSGLDPFPYLIISDGCSSGIDTDVGSRIIVSMAKKNIHLLKFNYKKFVETTILQSKTIASLMGLKKESLLATLYIIIKLEDKLIVLSIGDGDIIYKKDGEIVSINFEYEHNIPYYPIYIGKGLDNKNNLIINRNNVKEIKEFTHINYMELSLDNLEWIVCSTDGMTSFTNGSILYNDFSFITDFKQFKGEFIERKMKRFIKTVSKEGYQNDDDWTMGGMSFGE
jgi:hypothetical protein